MAGNQNMRQELRRFAIQPETTVKTYGMGSGILIPATSDSRLVETADILDNSVMLDGISGAIANTVGSRRWGGTLACEVRDYSGPAPFPPWVLMLLASGCQAVDDGVANTLTITPSTQPVTNWPGFTAGDRAPCALSVIEISLDQNTADSGKKAAGVVLASKLSLPVRGRPVVSGTPTGLVVASEFEDFSTTNLASIGTRDAGEGVDSLAWLPSTVTTAIVTDSGSTSAAFVNFKGIELDFASVVPDAFGTTQGYDSAPVFHASACPVTLELADTTAVAEMIALGLFTGRSFMSVVMSIALSASRSITVTIPRIQFLPGEVTKDAPDALRMFSVSGHAVRMSLGVTTSPWTIVWKYEA